MIPENEVAKEIATPEAAPEAAPAAAPEAVPEAAPEAAPAEGVPAEGAPEGEPVVAEWNPNYKVSVMDKELDFYPELKTVATKENYDKIKELHEKAYGLDIVKERFNETKEEVKKLKETEKYYGEQQSFINELSGFLDKKDLQSFFTKVGIPEQSVLKYALDRAKYHELPEDQRRVEDETYQSQQRLTELEKQNQFLQQGYQTQQTQVRMQQVDIHLGQGNIKPIADSFDVRVGQPGAFKEEVIRRGQLAYYNKGIDLPVEEAVNQVIGLIGNQAQPQGGVPPQTPTQLQTPGQEKPVIPQAKAGTQSPARKVFRSVQDLRDHAQKVL